MQAPTFYNEIYTSYTASPDHQQFESKQSAPPTNGAFVNMNGNSRVPSYEAMPNYQDVNSSNPSNMNIRNFHDDQMALGANVSSPPSVVHHEQIFNNHNLHHHQQMINEPIYSPVYQDFLYDIHDTNPQPITSHSMMDFPSDITHIHNHSQYDSFPLISTEYECSLQEQSHNSYVSPPLSATLSQAEGAKQTNYTIASAAVEQQPKKIIHGSFPNIDTTSPTPISPVETPLPSPTTSSLSNRDVSSANTDDELIQASELKSSPRNPLPRHMSSPNHNGRRSSLPSNNRRISKATMIKRASTSPNITTTLRGNEVQQQIIQHTTQPGPIPATKPTLKKDSKTGEEFLMFSYSRRKIIKNFTIKCPIIQQKFEEFLSTLPQQFLLENCVYPRAMCPEDEYKGNRYNYERECNEIGWNLAWLNPEIRDHRGLIQRAVDSWRNTRDDKKLRSRRVRKSEITA